MSYELITDPITMLLWPEARGGQDHANILKPWRETVGHCHQILKDFLGRRNGELEAETQPKMPTTLSEYRKIFKTFGATSLHQHHISQTDTSYV